MLKAGDVASAVVRGRTCPRCGKTPTAPLATTNPRCTKAEEGVPFPGSCVNGRTSFVADLHLVFEGGGQVYVYVLSQEQRLTVEERILLRNTPEVLVVSGVEAAACAAGGKVLQLTTQGTPGVPLSQRWRCLEECGHCAEEDSRARRVRTPDRLLTMRAMQRRGVASC